VFYQVFATYCKAAESAMQTQQDILHQWVNHWSTAMAAPAGNGGTEQVQTVQKRWVENSIDVMNKHRELLDTQYKTGIQTIEDAFRIAEAKDPEEYLNLIEDLRRKSFENLRTSAETQMVESQAAMEKWLRAMARESVEEAILRRAYLKWLGEGCPDGQDRRHYFDAAREVRA